ncbi:hypothetical protein MTO96_036091 [Rhipicephalus appendiculatus]
MVHCGRHEVPNRGHHRDHFCHPEATWKTVLRMRPDCVCAPGYLRNSWGDCISYAECHHCMDKHHLNMDYNLCESQCPLVCNRPIDSNCPDTCYEECACRPGYIRSRPNGPCISIHQCLPGCPSSKQYFTLCRSACPATCGNPFPFKLPRVLRRRGMCLQAGLSCPNARTPHMRSTGTMPRISREVLWREPGLHHMQVALSGDLLGEAASDVHG